MNEGADSTSKRGNKFCDWFNWLPPAAIVGKKIFCWHGGISKALYSAESLSIINEIERPTEVPEEGLLWDLLWSDPDPNVDTYDDNEMRGISWVFGADALYDFKEKFNIDLVCRGHEVVADGYEFFSDRQLVTIFWAPNYSGEFDNDGAIMTVKEDLTWGFKILKPIDYHQESNS